MNGANFDYIVVLLYERAGLRHAAIGLLVLLAAIAFHAAAALGEEKTPVTLRIENASESAVLRCQLVLAHFMTGDPPSAGPGRAVRIDLHQAAATGTLFYAGPGGRLVDVENVLCGVDDDWVATRNDIDLTVLREGSTQRLEIICAERTGLFCAAVETTKD